MSNKSFVLDTPSQLEAYRILATLRGLELEIKMTANGWPPTACPTRGMALHSAQRILLQYKGSGGGPGRRGTWRTRKQARAAMQQLCEELGLVPKESNETQGHLDS